MTTFASLFTGFGGTDVGAMQAGLTPVWGVEYDRDIAGVARRNLDHPVTVADVLECDPHGFEPVDVLHASPPCPNFSQAKTNGKESDHDVALAAAVCWFVATLQPRFVTLENVYMYRKSVSFRWIVKVLRAGSYHVRWWHLNAADYGVPQSRKRLIMAAARDFVPQRPPATHAPPEEVAPAFDERRPWVGWYEAIEDLIPELPDSKFADWQLKRLPEEIRTMLVKEGDTWASKPVAAEPAATVSSTNGFRAFIAPAVNGDGTAHPRNGDGPTHTIQATAYKQMPRAFIASSHSVNGGEPARRDDNEPAVTVDTKEGRVRAFIVGDEERQIADEKRPAYTVRAGENGGSEPRAFVINGENAGNEWGKLRRDGDEPHYSLSGNSSTPRAYTRGRVVQMTPRALARFQTFPDWYDLPESKTLACRGIGNACPPLLMRRLYESLLERLR